MTSTHGSWSAFSLSGQLFYLCASPVLGTRGGWVPEVWFLFFLFKRDELRRNVLASLLFERSRSVRPWCRSRGSRQPGALLFQRLILFFLLSCLLAYRGPASKPKSTQRRTSFDNEAGTTIRVGSRKCGICQVSGPWWEGGRRTVVDPTVGQPQSKFDWVVPLGHANM